MKTRVCVLLGILSAAAQPALAAQNYYYKTPAADTTMPPSTGAQGIVGITLPKGTWAVTANGAGFTGGAQYNYIDCYIEANKGTIYGRGSAGIGFQPGFNQLANVPVSTVITITSTQIVALACNLEYVPKYKVVVSAQGTFLTAQAVALH
jgi:hypothetical protein